MGCMPLYVSVVISRSGAAIAFAPSLHVRRLGIWICARTCIGVCGLCVDHLLLHIRALARKMIVLSVALFDFSLSLLLERAACCLIDYLPAHLFH